MKLSYLLTFTFISLIFFSCEKQSEIEKLEFAEADENSTDLQILESQSKKKAYKETLSLISSDKKFSVSVEFGSFDKKAFESFKENYTLSLISKKYNNVTPTKSSLELSSTQVKVETPNAVYIEMTGEINRNLLKNYALELKLNQQFAKNARSISAIGGFDYKTGKNPEFASLYNDNSVPASWDYSTKACWLCGFNTQNSGILNLGESEDVNPPSHLYKVCFSGEGEQGAVYFSWY